jgi:hypothetical protein
MLLSGAGIELSVVLSTNRQAPGTNRVQSFPQNNLSSKNSLTVDSQMFIHSSKYQVKARHDSAFCSSAVPYSLKLHSSMLRLAQTGSTPRLALAIRQKAW